MVLKKYLFVCFMFFSLTFLFAQSEEEGIFAQPDIPGELSFDVGLNRWNAFPERLTRRLWGSKSVSIYYSLKKPLGSRFSFYYAIGLSTQKISLGDSATLSQTNTTSVIDLPVNDVRKNQIATTFFEVPLMLRFYPQALEDERGWFIGVGGMIGYRFWSHTKWKYKEEGVVKKQKITGNFDLNNLRYGYQIRFGFKGIHLFYKQYLSKTFKNTIDGANPTTTAFGITLTGF